MFCFVCIKAEHIFHVHWPGFEFLRYVWGPEAGGTARLQSQGEGGAANPHRTLELLELVRPLRGTPGIRTLDLDLKSSILPLSYRPPYSGANY